MHRFKVFVKILILYIFGKILRFWQCHSDIFVTIDGFNGQRGIAQIVVAVHFCTLLNGVGVFINLLNQIIVKNEAFLICFIEESLSVERCYIIPLEFTVNTAVSACRSFFKLNRFSIIACFRSSWRYRCRQTVFFFGCAVRIQDTVTERKFVGLFHFYAVFTV